MHACVESVSCRICFRYKRRPGTACGSGSGPGRVRIEIQRTAESLNQCHRAALRALPVESRLFDQVVKNGYDKIYNHVIGETSD